MKRFLQLRHMRFAFFILVLAMSTFSCVHSQIISKNKTVITGAERTGSYFPLLHNKRVAVFANQTSMIGKTHLVDSLRESGIKLVKIFSPEHGFRGKADAGEEISSSRDKKTGLPIISLYGDHKKPTIKDLSDVDVVVFDIQDVGVRFYTYISSLQYLMEACIEQHKPLLILDRPNPNGFYVDGPVLDTAYRSFIGMQPVPIVYGMTIGEYAMMLTGENWLSEKANQINAYNVSTIPTADTPFHVMVLKCKNYSHTTKYQLPIPPSPNLKDMKSIYLYPSTCFFEGSVLSEGRGTDKPFQVFGYPGYPKNMFSFTPQPNEGAKQGKWFNQKCYGWSIKGTEEEILHRLNGKIQLQYLLEAYKLFPGKDSFFLKNNFINKLAGNNQLAKQVKEGKTESEIRRSWEPQLSEFKKIRKKYLLYEDFE